MKPTIGRIVHYYPLTDGKTVHVGIVSYVRESGNVNLACFNTLGSLYNREDVEFYESKCTKCSANYCTWPELAEDPLAKIFEGVEPTPLELIPSGFITDGFITPNPMIGPGTVNPDTKQERYKGKSGEDLIDRWAREDTPDVFRIKIMAQIERYASRYGKKDVTLKEAVKIQDYATRLVEYETKLLEKK